MQNRMEFRYGDMRPCGRIVNALVFCVTCSLKDVLASLVITPAIPSFACVLYIRIVTGDFEWCLPWNVTLASSSPTQWSWWMHSPSLNHLDFSKQWGTYSIKIPFFFFFVKVHFIHILYIQGDTQEERNLIQWIKI